MYWSSYPSLRCFLPSTYVFSHSLHIIYISLFAIYRFTDRIFSICHSYIQTLSFVAASDAFFEGDEDIEREIGEKKDSVENKSDFKERIAIKQNCLSPISTTKDITTTKGETLVSVNLNTEDKPAARVYSAKPETSGKIKSSMDSVVVKSEACQKIVAKDAIDFVECDDKMPILDYKGEGKLFK